VSKAFVLLTLEVGTQDATRDELLTLNGVSYAYKVDGAYDIFLILERNTVEDLRTAISKIRRIESVRTSLTLMVR
jgi:hypothetical protein